MAKYDYDELKLTRKEKLPEAKTVCQAVVIAKNSKGLFLDINKTFEGYIPIAEMGKQGLSEYSAGDKIDVFVLSNNQNNDHVFKLSIKEIENAQNWSKLEELKDQNLELKIIKQVKSGFEAEILATGQTGFIPSRYLDTAFGVLKGKEGRECIGLNVSGRIHELDKEKNKIILNNKVISDEQRKAKADETLRSLSVGQTINGTVVRCADFGVFVDIGGIDALVPASELSWRRFKKPADIVNIGDEITAKVFRVEVESKKVGISIKQASDNPWTVLNENFQVGSTVKGKVVTQAEFGVFVEVLPGIEALLHKSNFQEDQVPAIGSEVEAVITNLEPNKKRMGISLKSESKTENQNKPVEEKKTEETTKEDLVSPAPVSELVSNETKPEEDTKELEYVK